MYDDRDLVQFLTESTVAFRLFANEDIQPQYFHNKSFLNDQEFLQSTCVPHPNNYRWNGPHLNRQDENQAFLEKGAGFPQPHLLVDQKCLEYAQYLEMNR